MSSASLMQRLGRLDEWPKLDLLNPDLLFGTAWFWTLPEVHEAQKEIDARIDEFRRSVNEFRRSIDEFRRSINKRQYPNAPLPPTMDSRENSRRVQGA